MTSGLSNGSISAKKIENKQTTGAKFRQQK